MSTNAVARRAAGLVLFLTLLAVGTEAWTPAMAVRIGPHWHDLSGPGSARGVHNVDLMQTGPGALPSLLITLAVTLTVVVVLMRRYPRPRRHQAVPAHTMTGAVSLESRQQAETNSVEQPSV